MRIIECEQNSPEWYDSRRGVITASSFKDVMSKGKTAGSISKTRTTYLNTIVGERVSNLNTEFYSNGYMERGHEQEVDAVEAYEDEKMLKVEKVGFCISDCGVYGCSPDRLIDDDGLLEIKTAMAKIQVENLLKLKKTPESAFPSTHKAQVQGQLWVTGREYCDFVWYSPNMPLFLVRVMRDEQYINELKDGVMKFNNEADELVSVINGMR